MSYHLPQTLLKEPVLNPPLPTVTPEGSGPHGGNGYFFMRNQMLKGKIGKVMSEWTEDEKSQLTESYRKKCSVVTACNTY